MKTKITPFVENIGEATAACLITMAQGNFLALGITHWVIASQTGLVAGVAASVALLLTQTRSRWVIAIVLGVATAIVDYFMHPGMIGRRRIVFCCWRITKILPRETSSNSSLRQLIRSCLVQALSEALDRSNHRDQCKYGQREQLHSHFKQRCAT